MSLMVDDTLFKLHLTNSKYVITFYACKIVRMMTQIWNLIYRIVGNLFPTTDDKHI